MGEGVSLRLRLGDLGGVWGGDGRADQLAAGVEGSGLGAAFGAWFGCGCVGGWQ